MFVFILITLISKSEPEVISCKDLAIGQFVCQTPTVSNDTQEYEGCGEERRVRLNCYPTNKIKCRYKPDTKFEIIKTFNGTEKCDDLNYWLKCRYTNGKSYSHACLLSLFFGVFGVDRFYLGYPVIGLIKLCTFGMLGIGALADVLLILLQRVGPSDGSDLIMPFYGFRVNYMWSDENTRDLTNQL